MSARIAIDLAETLKARLEPTVVRWNRLEGRPRDEDFRRAMRADVRDAAWMLCRQWQMGEFEGDDCGSPAEARLHMRHTPLSDYAPKGGAGDAIDPAEPLEPRVESLPIALSAGTDVIALDIRLAIGRRWLAMLAANPLLAGCRSAYLNRYPVVALDLATRHSGLSEAHMATAQMFAAAAGRCLDGGGLLAQCQVGTASDGLSGLPSTLIGPLNDLGDDLLDWYARVFNQPKVAPAWQPERLEYAFSIDAAARPDTASFVADGYHAGHVDWHSFDRSRAAAPVVPPVTGITRTLLPTPLQFYGMPNTRWWALEDGRVNFGDVKPDRVDLGRMLLVEFGLVYANDWFLVPVDTPVGSISDIGGLAVANTFGERTWIEAAGKGASHGWRGWRMFAMSRALDDADRADDLGLMLAPAAVKVLEGPALEEVLFTRDEMSNLVWGVERTVPLPHGDGKAGSEAAAEMLAYQKRWFPPPAAAVWQADLRYEIMTTVPENWIAFTPVHMPGSQRAIQLQRAVIMRTLDGDPLPPQKVRPRTSLLREGMDAGQPYFLFEEEIPRAGARVTKAFRRARSRSGRVITWLAAAKRAGRGEGQSGLAFDRTPPTS